MRERDEPELVDCGLDEVVLDRDDAIVAEEDHTLLLQVPMVYSATAKEKTRNKSLKTWLELHREENYIERRSAVELGPSYAPDI